MNKIFARTQPKTGTTQFYRAGIAFTDQWQAVEVDDATLMVLQAEQMLEVTTEAPADFVAVPTDVYYTDTVITDHDAAGIINSLDAERADLGRELAAACMTIENQAQQIAAMQTDLTAALNTGDMLDKWYAEQNAIISAACNKLGLPDEHDNERHLDLKLWAESLTAKDQQTAAIETPASATQTDVSPDEASIETATPAKTSRKKVAE